MVGGTLRDFTMILLAVSVIALCALILSTVVRAAFHKRSLIVDSATEHLVHPDDGIDERDHKRKPDMNGKFPDGGVGGVGGGGGGTHQHEGGLFVPPEPPRMHR